jgi:hypothetical protein
MATVTLSNAASAAEHLIDRGYVILEGILATSELDEIRNAVDELCALERHVPYDPGDGPPAPEDESIEEFLAKSYLLLKPS